MTFEITSHTVPVGGTPVDLWRWRLVKAGGEAIAASPSTYSSEDEARRACAALKKAAGGFRFARVETVDDTAEAA